MMYTSENFDSELQACLRLNYRSQCWILDLSSTSPPWDGTANNILCPLMFEI